MTTTQPITQASTETSAKATAELTGRPANNLDFLRLVGAFAVIVGHSYHLLGSPGPVPWLLGYSISTLGVVIFFSISGYLITASWLRSRDPLSYLAARFLRIFPGLVVVIAVSALLIGPLVSTLPAGEYYGNDRMVSYLYNIGLYLQYDLPGVFADLPYPVAVNGSLWTLPAEFFCYLVVPVAFLVPKATRMPMVLLLLALSLWAASVPPLESRVIYGSRLSDAAAMWVFFAAGALLRLAHARHRGLLRADVAVALLASYLVVISVYPSWVLWTSWIALPYVVLTVGLASTPYVRRASRYGDLSYGLYVWAFPVQQLVVHLIGVQQMLVNLVLVTAITTVLAWLSWHLVESPSLRLKDRLVARRRPAGRQVATTPT
ncbi:acyltransferase [Nocardioides sp. 616]|uniref:acyltransferase family protein n=1 Tax=Nocardioides sp. 616 TaxID=2268090 RepID=UPI000CE4CC23|nr:acyltransferase [Nocardioides sp. 616]